MKSGTCKNINIEKKAYKKLHLIVDQHHLIQSSDLTDSHTQDQSVVKNCVSQLNGAYDNNPTYKIIAEKSSEKVLMYVLLKSCTS